MRTFLIFTLMMALSAPAFAQDAADTTSASPDVAAETPAAAPDAPAAPADDDAARMALAVRMHEIWPVRTRVEDAIAIVAENVPAAERDAFITRMRKTIDQKTLEQESIKAMAQVFTTAELQAMVNFYGSAEGRAVSEKTEDYMAILQPVMVKMLDSALLDMRTGAPLQSTPPKAP